MQPPPSAPIARPTAAHMMHFRLPVKNHCKQNGLERYMKCTNITEHSPTNMMLLPSNPARYPEGPSHGSLPATSGGASLSMQINVFAVLFPTLHLLLRAEACIPGLDCLALLLDCPLKLSVIFGMELLVLWLCFHVSYYACQAPVHAANGIFLGHRHFNILLPGFASARILFSVQ